jgi:primosomal protein N' (replication factor Y)
VDALAHTPVVLNVGPSQSVVALIAEFAALGPVLVVCPTYRMVRLGAAALRRRGLTTAELPEQWDYARAGVDVSIGTRGAVWAPVAPGSTVIIVDEHDEALVEERSPTWNARQVALIRHNLLGDSVVLASPIPSLSAMEAVGSRVLTPSVTDGAAWPEVVIEDLADVGVAGSLLSSALLGAIANPQKTVACVLNVKGGARLVQCKSCKELQRCGTCDGVLSASSQNGVETLYCSMCAEQRGSVCVTCGRTAFSTLKAGVARWCEQIERATGVQAVEVTADSDNPEKLGRVFVGTEALLHRLPAADVVVFLDIDRDLGVPRATAERETLALLSRAARLVGARGSVVVQTRQPHHRVLQALHHHSLNEWMVQDAHRAQMFGMPPFSAMARIKTSHADVLHTVCHQFGSSVAEEADDTYLVRAATHDGLLNLVAELRAQLGTTVRVYVDPPRY